MGAVASAESAVTTAYQAAADSWTLQQQLGQQLSPFLRQSLSSSSSNARGREKKRELPLLLVAIQYNFFVVRSREMPAAASLSLTRLYTDVQSCTLGHCTTPHPLYLQLYNNHVILTSSVFLKEVFTLFSTKVFRISPSQQS